MPTNDDLELGVGNSANDPTVVLASVDHDGNSNFVLGRAVFEAGPTEHTIPQQPFIGMLGRGSNGLGNTTAPMRAWRARRSKENSTHPASPAESVSPATPQLGSIPSNLGSGSANR